jgi:O-antigen/teichoic acid export membrane protein
MIAGGITMLTLPIITQIFSVSDLGKYQMLLSIIMIFGVVASLKFETAMVLPKDNEMSGLLFQLSIFVLILFTVTIAFINYFFYETLMESFNGKVLSKISMLIPIGIFFYGLLEIIKYGLIRMKKFNDYAKVQLYKVVITQSSAIGVGLFYPHFISLFGSYLIGFIIVSILFFKKSFHSVTHLTAKSIKYLVVQYKKFPIINSSMVFINTLSNELPVFFLGKFFSLEMVGFYMLANKMAVLPMNLLGTSVTKVYLQKASDSYNHSPRQLSVVYKKTVKRLVTIGFIPFLCLGIFAPIMTKFIFGSEWYFSGVIMQILALSMFLRFTTSPISSTFTILNKQEIALFLTIISLILRFGAMYMFRNNIESVMWALTASTGLYYLVYNFIIYKLILKMSKHN